MDLQGWSSLILALVGVGGLVTSTLLSRQGTRRQEIQEHAAGKLNERIQAFQELERLNDNLREENERLRGLLGEAEQVGNHRLAIQAGRCRDRLEDLIAVVAGLRGVVLSEIARASADTATDTAQTHLRSDHPEQ